MKATLVLASAVSMASAAKQSILTLGSEERSILKNELDEWKAQFLDIAQAMGALPTHTESLTDVESDELQRFLDTKIQVEVARQANPEAEFDVNNPFALLTHAEFLQMVQVSFDQSSLGHLNAVEDTTPVNVTATSADWTTSKCLSPVRNQGSCGSCWAFSTIGAAETAHCLASGQLLDLSEQQLVSCSKNGGSMGCSGGWPQAAMDWLKDGACLESTYPYTAQTGSCSTSCAKTKLSFGQTIKSTGEDKLASALDSQPVSVLVESGNAVWRNYKSGVVTQCPGGRSDHAVIAVGYDATSFKIKNSWGTSWGNGGYMTLKRGVGGKGMCNVAEAVVYPALAGDVKPTSQSPTPSTRKPFPTSPSSSTRKPFPSSSNAPPTTKPRRTRKPRASKGGHGSVSSSSN
ncbi:hypothetical protein B5M09_009890 [Aphanomyces astaci]|uniref:Peptidase C1A papain C-terminal domain-containing protein n=1 Tax=Aphanomyces astaci TaxID=112090 RepID=A0A425CYA7_APHAT|nr:hypothetical protein B5M09_009890 [Aphanomyces astaci]